MEALGHQVRKDGCHYEDSHVEFLHWDLLCESLIALLLLNNQCSWYANKQGNKYGHEELIEGV